jgi:integrase/recombinase XerD
MGLTTMSRLPIKGVTTDIDRYGNLRYYYRRPGQRKIRIHGKPGSEEFAQAYQAALEGRALTPASKPAKTDHAAPGSFLAVCDAYYASPEFRGLDASTKAWRRRSLDAVCEEHGAKPIRLMEPRHIYKLRDVRAATPGAANTLLKALKALFKWALKRHEVERNPARDVEPIAYQTTGFHSWTLEEVKQYESRHPVGTKARLAMALLLYTTGRREDAVRLGPLHRKNGRLRYTQAKNEHRSPVEMDIPVHPDLALIIDSTPLVGKDTFLVTDYGKAFTAPGFGNKFRDWCDQAGLTHCSAHGLRKAMAARLAERGATPHEIMAITGHQTLEEVERYTRAAGRAALADSAMKKVGPVPLSLRRKSGGTIGGKK